MGNPKIEDFENLTPTTSTRLLVFDESDYGRKKYIAGSDILTAAGLNSTAAELNLIDNADRVTKIVKVALTASDAAAGLFSWRNTEESADIIVTRLVVDVTTAATGACTADIGTAATSILNDTLLDGVDVGTAAGVFDNIDNQGTNGLSKVRVDDDEYVTGSVASGASAGIVGNVYIHYFVI